MTPSAVNTAVCRKDQADDLRPPRSKRDTDPDLARAARDDEAEHAVDADRGEGYCHDSEETEQHRIEARLCHRVRDDLIQHRDVVDRH
jgi:hypothetical protein